MKLSPAQRVFFYLSKKALDIEEHIRISASDVGSGFTKVINIQHRGVGIALGNPLVDKRAQGPEVYLVVASSATRRKRREREFV